MSMEFLDQDILNDFLTESGELIDELDADLVTLEDQPENIELLNRIFRALHTIKGSGSFLEIVHLVEFAHKAEDALNIIRTGEVKIDEHIMDVLLQSVDIIRHQLTELGEGEQPSPGPTDLIQCLLDITGGASSSKDKPSPEAAKASSEPNPDTTATLSDAGSDKPVIDSFDGAVYDTPIDLPESKQDLIEYMQSDLMECLDQISAELDQCTDITKVDDAAEELVSITESLSRCVEFFEFNSMGTLVSYLEVAGDRLAGISQEHLNQALPRLQAIVIMLRTQHECMSDGIMRTIEASLLGERLVDVLLGHVLEPTAMLPDGSTAADALRVDMITVSPTDAIASEESKTDEVTATESSENATTNSSDSKTSTPPSTSNASTNSSGEGKGKNTAKGRAEATIRVEVGRLETLLNLVGELVIQKNRIAALSRNTAALGDISQEFTESLSQASNDLDHVSSLIQMGVMRTRMQPLDKLFGKYPRLIRDLARNTGKKIDLKIIGGATEVDKSILEELGDPLVHILRNSADHGIEDVETRAASGKPETGTICIEAAHQGSHVCIQIRDNGAGLNRDRISKSALSKGIVTPEELEAMTDKQIIMLVMKAGFSTAAQVSNLSGRGVGMDVVRTNIESLDGSLDLESVEGESTTISIKIPLTVAILNAMIVCVSEETYAIPLTNIKEIVRPEPSALSTVNGQVVMRLRDSVLPLINLSDEFEIRKDGYEHLFAVVVESGEKSAGLMVSSLVGQQEIVIKPLDDGVGRNPAISGATVRDDGGVSLILDVAKIIEGKAQSIRMAS